MVKRFAVNVTEFRLLTYATSISLFCISKTKTCRCASTIVFTPGRTILFLADLLIDVLIQVSSVRDDDDDSGTVSGSGGRGRSVSRSQRPVNVVDAGGCHCALPNNIDRESIAWGRFTTSGGRLELYDCG